MRRIVLALFLGVLATGAGFAQTHKKAAGNQTEATGAYSEPAATLHGTLKRIKGKELLLLGDGDQLVTIWLTGKTRFLKDGHEIKRSDIAPGSALAVDTSENPDLSPRAINVRVEAPPAE